MSQHFHEMARFLIVLLPCALGFVPGSPSPAGARAGVARAAGGKDRSFIPPSADKYYEQIAQRREQIARGEADSGFVDDASALAAMIDLDLTTPTGEPLSPSDSALARQLREEEHNLNEFDGVADADLEDALLDMFKSQGDVREGSE